MCCDICHINLCIACVGEHLFDRSKEHKVVPFEERGSTINYPKCQKHSPKTCELHCKHCNIPICASCVSSGDHEHHKNIDILTILSNKKELIENDLQELKIFICPKFQQAASKIPAQKADVKQRSLNLTAALNKQGEAMHKEINSLIQRKQSEIEDMDKQHLAAITTQEDLINKALNEIKQVILDLQKLLVSDDICLVSEYTSRNEEFRNLPPQFQVTLPTFSPHEINKEQLYQQLGSLSELVITYPLIDEAARRTEEHDGGKKTPGAVSSPKVRPFSDKLLSDTPRILTDIQTEYGGGEILESVKTISEKAPKDIAVTRSGGLVYADCSDRSINLVSGTQIHTLIKQRGWKPRGLCIMSSGDLLVAMTSDDRKQTKVVRYSGSTEKQIIQWDDKEEDEKKQDWMYKHSGPYPRGANFVPDIIKVVHKITIKLE
uniref:E3 ubiquitin-protein ligase TRIM36-like n=1 Tax=Crassostrea virginica TaxID=6565 RepID=A0A8B8BQJ9_CRAVI|nr:E3 ubiquitin-protein ligase TRIM36-like [Crassostrea virginica]